MRKNIQSHVAESDDEQSVQDLSFNQKSNNNLNHRSITLSKRKPKLATVNDQQAASVLKFDRNVKRVELIPRNTAQETYIEELLDETKRIILAVGPAGTGKTLMAVQYAIRQLKAGDIERIIITRPVVTVDEDLGFLPGSMLEKMAPFIRPLMDVFEEYYSKQAVIRMLEDGIIECCPLAYIRGRTFKNAIVILDECQSTTPNQLKAALTRIGEGSRMIVTGDLNQADKGMDGLHDFLERLKKKNPHNIALVEFSRNHIERDPIVATILDIYGDK
jgi:phosphate starvation-inducible PhoH-like protein